MLAAALTPDRPGRYTVYAEIERRDSGTQVLTRDFTLGGGATAAPAEFGGFVRAAEAYR